MFDRKKQPAIKSLIAQGSSIEGHCRFTDGLRIDGEVVGDVTAHADSTSILVVSESARITGAVVADHVIVNGTVLGPIRASQLLELQPKARVEGDVEYKALEVHQGALITGQLRPLMPDEEKPTLKLAANNA